MFKAGSFSAQFTFNVKISYSLIFKSKVNHCHCISIFIQLSNNKWENVNKQEKSCRFARHAIDERNHNTCLRAHTYTTHVNITLLFHPSTHIHIICILYLYSLQTHVPMFIYIWRGLLLFSFSSVSMSTFFGAFFKNYSLRCYTYVVEQEIPISLSFFNVLHASHHKLNFWSQSWQHVPAV